MAKMDTESQIIEWIDELGFQEGQSKVLTLKKIQELLIHQRPSLLPDYLENVILYSNDKNQEVKRTVIGFIEEVCKTNISLLPLMVTNLHLLLADTVVAVQKRLIQAANIIYKNALKWICKANDTTPEMALSWKMLNELKLQILNMVDSENEGIRTNSIKFLGGIVILQTSSEGNSKTDDDFSLEDIPLNLNLIKRKNLEDEATHIFDLLVKFHNSEHISGMNLMACMTALCDVGKTRPKFLARVIQALEELHTTLPPTLTQSQVNSVRKHLKMQLINVIKSTSSVELLPQLAQMLLDLGMTTQEVAKVIPREKRNKRLLEFKKDKIAKRARIDSPQSNSQGSDKSEGSLSQDAVIEDEVTEKSLLEGLNDINCVINLVSETMNNFPEEMPSEFAKLYEPISKSSTILPKPALAKLLLTIIKEEMPVPQVPTQSEPKEDENKINLKNALAKLQTKKQIDGAVSRLMEETRNETKALEAAREREIVHNVEEKNKVLPLETPTIPRLKQRIKTIKLHEVTKPLPKAVKEKILLDSIKRILKAERSSRDGKVASIREKMLTTFAVSYGSTVRENILSFILEDIEIRLELALSWLYEEYSHVQEFNRSNTSVGKFSDKSGINYNNLLCSLITNIADMPDNNQEVLREILFRRIYLESPLITDDALAFLIHTCKEDGKTLMGLNLLKDMIMFQPPKASKYVTSMLPLAIHKNTSIREETINRIVDIYHLPNDAVKRAVDKHTNLYLGFIALSDPPKDLFDIDTFQKGNTQGWTDDLYKICLQLFVALIPYNEDSLTNLCRAYAGAGVDGKRCVLRLLDVPIHKMGPEDPILLSFIEECPKGAETLVTKIIHLLTEKAPPTEHLVNKVRNLYVERVSDVRFLIPVITGLTKQEIYAALPKLIKLNPIVVKEVFTKLLGTQSDSSHPLPVTAAELLIALHFIDQSKAELKYVVKATSLCFAEKEAYTSEVLEEVLQTLSEQAQLPVLLMRSVLQALSLHPTKLAPLVIKILKTLVTKQVWEHKVVWEGFIKCCQRLKPQSCLVLIGLPPEPLRWALEACKDLTIALDKVLPNIANIPPHVTLVTKECMILGGYGQEESGEINLNEPLPPGME